MRRAAEQGVPSGGVSAGSAGGVWEWDARSRAGGKGGVGGTGAHSPLGGAAPAPRGPASRPWEVSSCQSRTPSWKTHGLVGDTSRGETLRGSTFSGGRSGRTRFGRKHFWQEMLLALYAGSWNRGCDYQRPHRWPVLGRGPGAALAFSTVQVLCPSNTLPTGLTAQLQLLRLDEGCL